MLALLAAVIVSQSTTAKPIRIQDEGVTIGQGWIGTINCVGSSVTCTRNASTGVGTLTISGGGGGGLPDGGGVGADIPVVTYTSSGDLTAERVLTAGTNIALSTATPGQLGVSVTGTVASATTATQLAADPSACGGGQYVTDISAAGALTCSTPPGTYALPDSTASVTGGVRLTGDLGGTATSPAVVDDSHAHTGSTISGLDVGDITTGTLSQARGGTGAGALTCGAGQFLTSNGTAYSCGTPSGGASTTTVYAGNGSDTPTSVATTDPGVALASRTVTVAAGDVVIIEAEMDIMNNSGATKTYTQRCRIGTTTIVANSDSTTLAAGTTRGTYYLRCVFAVRSTSSLRATADLVRTPTTAAGTTQTAAERRTWNTSASNWTGAQTFALNVSTSATGATQDAIVTWWRLTHQAANP